MTLFRARARGSVARSSVHKPDRGADPLVHLQWVDAASHIRHGATW